MPKVVVIDNYDSFTYNLVQAIYAYTTNVHVFRNDDIQLAQLLELSPHFCVLSPGPGRPERPKDFGICRTIIHAAKTGYLTVPILGVCLGHQGIAAEYGARIIPAQTIKHGKTSLIHHKGTGIFAGLESPLQAMRYHSLVVDPSTLPSCLTPLAHTSDGTLMAYQHTTLPLFGVQFHPESIGTPEGPALIGNFLCQETNG
ncbi:MAG: aminodeoxychorismate/anthranilate synthase component II [Myxococcales bacterium]|nr:aminodeoxychorismate/anthranilate synthase component II [Myxococcales bacterium]